MTGPELFARYATPPNRLGYCGPIDPRPTLEVATTPALPLEEATNVAAAFEGAWPYLELLAHRDRKHPLDADVVEAYWLGGSPAPRVDPHDWWRSLDDRFRRQAASRWEAVVSALASGATPSHAFHVFCVYPWVGLLRAGFEDRGINAPSLDVLDGCRVSSAEVVSVNGASAVVNRRALTWEDDRLAEATPSPVSVTLPPGIGALPGDAVSVHWATICQVLDQDRLATLRRVHDLHLAIANHELWTRRTEPAR